MTINTESTKRIYDGNGTTTDFDYDFKIFVDTDLLVTLIDAAGNETVQVLNTDYTVTGEGFEAGGKVKFTSAPAAGVTVLIQSDVPYTQPTDFKNQGRFFPETHENAFDRAARQALQVSEKVGRALTLPAYVTGASTTLPVPSPSNLIGWNTSGDSLRNYTSSEIGTTLAFSNFIADTFIATAGQTDFTLTADPGALANLDVSIDGVTQVPTVDYTLSSATLAFFTPMSGGEAVLARYGTALPVGVADSSAVQFLQSGTGASIRTMQSKAREQLSALDFMSSVKAQDVLNRTGLYDHSPEILAALQSAISQKRELYLPAGLYVYDTTRIEPVLANGDVVSIRGDGMGRTVIREKSGGNVGKSTDLVLYVNVPNGVTVNQVTIRDLTIDKNGASNGSPPGSGDWQQSHAIRISTGTTNGLIKNCVIENVETLDKVGGGIVFAAGFIERAIVRNCHGRNFSGLMLERGDFENQAVIDFLTVEDCSGPYAQSEPNATTASGKSPRSVWVNCKYDSLELEGFTADVAAQYTELRNCQCTTKLLIRDMRLLIVGGRYRVDTVNYWRRLAPLSAMYGGTIINKYDSSGNSISPFYIQYTSTLGGTEMNFHDVTFEPEAGASGTTTGACFLNAAVVTSAQPYKIKFVDCKFSPIFQQTLDAYRAGEYEFIRCKIGGWSTTTGAVRVGSDNTNFSSVTFDSCDFSGVTGTYKVYRQDGGTNWKLRWRGTHQYSDYSSAYSGGGTNVATNEYFEGKFVSRSAPSAGGVIGQIVSVTNAAYGTAREYIATTNSISSATWRMTVQAGIKKDTTANRPTPSASDIGLQYLDTTLDADGKPIAWNGAAWVDATGAVV